MLMKLILWDQITFVETRAREEKIRKIVVVDVEIGVGIGEEDKAIEKRGIGEGIVEILIHGEVDMVVIERMIAIGEGREIERITQIMDLPDGGEDIGDK